MAAQTVMVIDDDPCILRLLHTILSMTGYTTMLAARGHDAYQVMREQQPDVVILDLHLETPDAADRVLDLMAADPATQHIPTIICSGDGAARRNRMKHWRRPAYAILAKPFQVDELMMLVQSAIAGEAECASPQR